MSEAPVDKSQVANEVADLAESSILLVEYNRRNLDSMQACLHSLRCRVRTATDGADAIHSIVQSAPDMILLDVTPPGKGLELCRMVKANPATRDIVMITVTIPHEAVDHSWAVECGIDGFLSRPVNKGGLPANVRFLLRVWLLKRRLDRLGC